MKTKLSLLFLFLLIGNTFCYAQKIVISGEETSRKLQWSDFTGKADESSSFFANTWWKINYRFDNVQLKADSAVINFFEVKLELDPEKSWVKKDKETDELLVHEQLHFNLGILCMNEFLDSYKKIRLTRDSFQNELQYLFKTILKKYTDMNSRYDQETNHGINKDEQLRWNTFVEQQLKQY